MQPRSSPPKNQRYFPYILRLHTLLMSINQGEGQEGEATLSPICTRIIYTAQAYQSFRGGGGSLALKGWGIQLRINRRPLRVPLKYPIW